MKPSPSSHPLAVLLLCLIGSTAALAETRSGGRFSLEAIAKPGGTLRGGRFELLASVNPDAGGRVHSTRFSLTAGALSPVTVIQDPEGPELRIRLHGGGRVEIYWKPGLAKVRLQGTADPVNGPWTDVQHPIQDSAEGLSVFIQPDDTMRCFRLGR